MTPSEMVAPCTHTRQERRGPAPEWEGRLPQTFAEVMDKWGAFMYAPKGFCQICDRDRTDLPSFSPPVR